MVILQRMVDGERKVGASPRVKVGCALARSRQPDSAAAQCSRCQGLRPPDGGPSPPLRLASCDRLLQLRFLDPLRRKRELNLLLSHADVPLAV